MKRARKAPHVPLTQLRLADLKDSDSGTAQRSLVNLKVPADALVKVHELARRLGVTKTAAIIALLNEGLSAARGRGYGKASSGRVTG